MKPGKKTGKIPKKSSPIVATTTAKTIKNAELGLPDSILIRYNEVGLKGKNRSVFEKKLVKNIVDIACLESRSIDEVTKRYRGRIILNGIFDSEKLNKIYGVSSYSPAFLVRGSPTSNGIDAWIEDIWNTIKPMLVGRKLNNNLKFRVSTRRLTKTTPMNSTEINALVGSRVVDLTGWTVNLNDYDVDVGIEIIEDVAYVFCETHDGPGGLPVGVSGDVLVLPGPEKMMLECALKLLKRGCTVSFTPGSGIKDSTKELLTKYGQRYVEKDNHWAVACPITKYGSNEVDRAQYNNSLILFPLI
ncbi:hypothetical protein K9M79_02425 [Candidatus Woesearchaeota archaeon]|nr:hypothetical protein [Candidatus Woesearchaeota archaeon]